MDNLGAIIGPLLAIGLVGTVGVRWAIGLSVIPGLLTALAIVYAIRHTIAPTTRERQPIRLHVRPVLRGRLGRLMTGITVFELGNCAATLLILRATELFQPGRSDNHATQLAIVLYVAYNLAATGISVPAGRHGDRHNPTRVLLAGAALFAAAYLWFAAGPSGLVALAPAFVLAGLGIGCVETAEHAAVATHAPTALRGSAFGLVAVTQSVGNLTASAVAGVLWTTISPAAAFIFLAVTMAIATGTIAIVARDESADQVEHG
jgi:MFS family permease